MNTGSRTAWRDLVDTRRRLRAATKAARLHAVAGHASAKAGLFTEPPGAGHTAGRGPGGWQRLTEAEAEAVLDVCGGSMAKAHRLVSAAERAGVAVGALVGALRLVAEVHRRAEPGAAKAFEGLFSPRGKDSPFPTKTAKSLAKRRKNAD